MKILKGVWRSTVIGLATVTLIVPTASTPADADTPSVRTEGGVPALGRKLVDLGSAQVQDADTFGSTTSEEDDDENIVLSPFEPNSIKADDIGNKDGALITFNFPDGCNATTAPGDIACSFGQGTFDPAVFDANGDTVPYRETTQGDSVALEVVPAAATEFPLTVTMYVGELTFTGDGEKATEVAATTLGDVIAMGEDLEFTDEELAYEEAELDAALSGPGGLTSLPTLRSPPLSPYAAKRPGKVTIPRNYKYCPKSCKPTSWHDYCTSAPDQPVVGKYRADFRGPCARHDMNIEAIMAKKISAASKRAQWYVANGKLKKQMKQQCQHQFAARTTFRQNCYVTLGVYYVAVSAHTFFKPV